VFSIRLGGVALGEVQRPAGGDRLGQHQGIVRRHPGALRHIGRHHVSGPVIDDEDALRELLDRAVTPPQVREEILKAGWTGRQASQLGSGAGRTKSRAGRPARRPRFRSG
jgi:hypothetical protein